MQRILFAKASWVVLVSVLVALLAAAACGGDDADKTAATGVDTEALSALVQEAVSAASSETVSAEDIAAIVDTAVAKATAAGGEALTTDEVVVIVATALAEQAAAAPAKSKGTIQMYDGPWDSHDVTRTLLEKILIDEMGYEMEHTTVAYGSLWPALAQGDIHVSIEHWTGNSWPTYLKFVEEEKTIDDVGPLGYAGHTGWYMPRYVVEGDADRGIEAVAPELVWASELNDYKDLFAVTETAPKGRIVAIETGWGQQVERVEAYDLDYEVVFAGSEAATLAELDGAFLRGDPIIVYGYTPHYMMRKWDLIELEQPPYSEECYAIDYGCHNPTDNLRTLVWPGLKAKFPEVYQFFQNVNDITDDDIAGMLLAYDAGTSYEEVTQAWMDRNQDKWQAWIP